MTKSTIVIEHEGTTDELHEKLCRAIHEGNPASQAWLSRNVSNVVHPTMQSEDKGKDTPETNELNKAVQFIQDTAQQYTDGLITGWEFHQLVTEHMSGLDVKAILDEHETSMTEQE
jgi:hypothetical protein